MLPLAGVAYATDAIGIHAVFGAFLIGVAMPRIESGSDAARARAGMCRGRSAARADLLRESGMAVDIPALEPGGRGHVRADPRDGVRGQVPRRVRRRARGRRPAREASAIGVLMNTRGLIEIVVLTVGLDRGLIDDRLFTLFALMAMATTLATTPLLRRTAPAAWSPLGARVTGRPAV